MYSGGRERPSSTVEEEGGTVSVFTARPGGMERILTISLLLFFLSQYNLQQHARPIRQTIKIAPHTLPSTATTITLKAEIKEEERKERKKETMKTEERKKESSVSIIVLRSIMCVEWVLW